MSRIVNQSIPVADGVEVSLAGTTITVKGPKGSLTHTWNAEFVGVNFEADAKNRRDP